mmetsp:Transcript_13734/g.25904  ORF Transcript_13734/g.25904 Transcript_13734/m.25904 type:complete len:110 (-) Transcript_13734:127-456(-)
MLYVLGGYNGTRFVTFIQELSLERLEWRLLDLRLPSTFQFSASFKLGSQCCLSQAGKFYVLDFKEFKSTLIKSLPGSILGKLGPSHYSKGTLYATNCEGRALEQNIGCL